MRKNVTFNLVGSLVYQGCLWLTTVLVVVFGNGYRWSGVLSLAMSISNLFIAVATYNMRTYQVSDTGEYTQANYIAFRLVTIVIGLGLFIPYTFMTVSDTAAVVIILTFLLFKMDEAFCDVLYGIEQRNQHMDYCGISQMLRGAALTIAFIFGIREFGSLELAVVLMAVSGMIITFTYDIRHAHFFAQLRPSITIQQIKSLLFRCLPLVLFSLFLGMDVTVARQCYSEMYGVESLGIYAAVATPAVLVQVMARYLYAPALVPLSQKLKESRENFIKYFNKVLSLMTLVIVALTVFLAIFANQLLHIVYGTRIDGYTYLFPMVLICTGMIAVQWYLSDVLVICRDLKGVLIANASTLLVCVVVMSPCEATFQMDGINYSIAVSVAVGLAIAILRILLTSKKQNKQNEKNLTV